ncbi:MAG TPA: 4a-hydroxytetrahydrobiopterin dehydratase [Ignavibacteriaceae bacterium]
MMQVLDISKINEKLGKLNGWKYQNDQIGRDYELKNFKEALSFVNKVGEIAEQMDHHPDIFIHGWNKVRITVSTHSAGGVTENDFKLAHKIEDISI